MYSESLQVSMLYQYLTPPFLQLLSLALFFRKVSIIESSILLHTMSPLSKGQLRREQQLGSSSAQHNKYNAYYTDHVESKFSRSLYRPCVLLQFSCGRIAVSVSNRTTEAISCWLYRKTNPESRLYILMPGLVATASMPLIDGWQNATDTNARTREMIVSHQQIESTTTSAAR